MAGPHSTNYGLAADGPPYRDPHPSQPLPTQPIPAGATVRVAARATVVLQAVHE